MEAAATDTKKGRSSKMGKVKKTKTLEATEFWDPDQPQAERQRIRAGYRSILREFEQNKEEFVRPNSKRLVETTDEIEVLQAQVRNTREAALDMETLLMASKLGEEQARNLNTNFAVFDKDAFRQNLMKAMRKRNATADQMEENPFDLQWGTLGLLARPHLRPVPKINFMYGPLSMDTSKKVVKQRAKRTKYDERDKVAPIEGKKAMTKAKESTTERVKEVYTVLASVMKKKGTKINNVVSVQLMPFIINPKDFGQTVENIFHLSFLVRENQVAIFMHDGIPMITLNESQGSNQSGTQPDKIQLVMEITMKEWKQLIEAFDIRKSTIPHRGPPET